MPLQLVIGQDLVRSERHIRVFQPPSIMKVANVCTITSAVPLQRAAADAHPKVLQSAPGDLASRTLRSAVTGPDRIDLR